MIARKRTEESLCKHEIKSTREGRLVLLRQNSALRLKKLWRRKKRGKGLKVGRLRALSAAGLPHPFHLARPTNHQRPLMRDILVFGCLGEWIWASPRRARVPAERVDTSNTTRYERLGSLATELHRDASPAAEVCEGAFDR